jgi:hypothetical protein
MKNNIYCFCYFNPTIAQQHDGTCPQCYQTSSRMLFATKAGSGARSDIVYQCQRYSADSDLCACRMAWLSLPGGHGCCWRCGCSVEAVGKPVPPFREGGLIGAPRYSHYRRRPRCSCLPREAYRSPFLIAEVIGVVGSRFPAQPALIRWSLIFGRVGHGSGHAFARHYNLPSSRPL